MNDNYIDSKLADDELSKEDKHASDIETLLKEIQQLKFELRAADVAYNKEIEEKDKAIAELKLEVENQIKHNQNLKETILYWQNKSDELMLRINLIIDKLKSTERHEIEMDNDGYNDPWWCSEQNDSGDWVKWENIEKILGDDN